VSSAFNCEQRDFKNLQKIQLGIKLETSQFLF